MGARRPRPRLALLQYGVCVCELQALTEYRALCADFGFDVDEAFTKRAQDVVDSSITTTAECRLMRIFQKTLTKMQCRKEAQQILLGLKAHALDVSHLHPLIAQRTTWALQLKSM